MEELKGRGSTRLIAALICNNPTQKEKSVQMVIAEPAQSDNGKGIVATEFEEHQ